jgi:alpha-glucoside transport system substrate-binding protein
MQELAAQKSLIALDSFLDMSAIRNDYSSAFIDLGTVSGKLYAIFYKAANKGTPSGTIRRSSPLPVTPSPRRGTN